MSKQLTGHERFFEPDELIVTKTDMTGRITYSNEVFQRMSGVTAKEALGAPHNLIRHPDMPRSVFKLLWDTIQSGGEIFAYVLNRASNGDHYWVFAHVTPSMQANGSVVGYHSNRRVPDRGVIERTIVPLYRELRAIEQRQASPRQAADAGAGRLHELLKSEGTDYEKFIFSLQG